MYWLLMTKKKMSRSDPSSRDNTFKSSNVGRYFDQVTEESYSMKVWHSFCCNPGCTQWTIFSSSLKSKCICTATVHAKRSASISWWKAKVNSIYVHYIGNKLGNIIPLALMMRISEARMEKMHPYWTIRHQKFQTQNRI